MGTILFISASPKAKRSASGRIAAAFLDAYREQHPQDTIKEIALFQYDLPEFGSLEVEAKFAPIFGETVTDQHRHAWGRIEREIETFKSADKILIASPMWNLGIPYKLKHYIDILVQPILTFGYDRERMTHVGHIKNKPLQLILTRSSVLPGDFADFQLPYLKYIFEFVGIHDIRVITAWQTTKPSHAEREAYIESFFAPAREAARAF